MELIRLEEIYKTYHLGEIDVPVLKGISLTIHRGEMVALMGASGSGKTTLMNLLGCLDRPSAGHYWFDGVDVAGLSPNQRAVLRSKKLGFVFQSFNLLARNNAVANVLMPLDYAPEHCSARDALRRACVMLDHVGLGDRFDHEPSQMSGGQQQRVAIARSLVNQPALLLADEPTGNLDSRTSAEILRMFQRLNAEGITILLVTHDPEVAKYAHRVIRIHDGQIIEDGPSEGVASDSRKSVPAPLGLPPSGACRADFSPPRVVPASPTGGLKSALPVAAAVAAGLAELSTEELGEAAGLQAAPAVKQGAILAHAAVSAELERKIPRPDLSSLLPPTLRTALGALRRNKLRSALTTLGVIIGVGAVISMMEIGEGSKTALQATIASMGANNLMIQPGAAYSNGVSFGVGTTIKLTPGNCDQILRECPAVANVAPMVWARTQVIYGNKNWVPRTICGTTPSFLVARDWEKLDEGAAFTDHDVRAGSRVCLIGETLVTELFDGQSPVNKEVRMQNVSLRVVGVLSRKGANMMGIDQDDIVLLPWTTLKFRVSGSMLTNVNQSAAAAAAASLTAINTLNNLYPGGEALYSAAAPLEQVDRPQPVRFANVDVIYAKVVSADRIDDAMAQITEVLRQQHHLLPDEPDDFTIRDLSEMTNTLASTSRLMSGLLLCVAAISLVVGGVGIMNIMLVSVTERTREIGLRMAVGARSGNILRQFLVEAVVLCLLGGAIGIALGRSSSYLVRVTLHWPIETSLPAILAAVAVSATVGVLFGWYPAWKASGLDPIEALRYE
jgi:ABC-type lipoprotein export system ATPase subunit/ABC-type antimicrobial peptide transport system permease subunit